VVTALPADVRRVPVLRDLLARGGPALIAAGQELAVWLRIARWTLRVAVWGLRVALWAAWCLLWGATALLRRLTGLLRRVPPGLALTFLALLLCVGAAVSLGRASARWAAAMAEWPAAVEAARAAGEPTPPSPQVEPGWDAGPVPLPAPFLGAGPLLLVLVVARVRAGAARAEVRALVRQTQREAAAFARSQGHLPAGELRRRLRLPHRRGAPLATGVPLGYLPRGTGERGARVLGGTPDPAPHRLCPCGLPWDADTGHLAVVGPARSGKGFHQTDSLLRWPGPAVVVDPKGEQWARTAGWRRRHVGPVYRVPDVGLDLGAYYDLATDRDRRELFALLLGAAGERPEHRIFTERNYPLLPAAVAVGAALGEHPLAVLARWARRGDPLVALREAGPRVVTERRFTVRPEGQPAASSPASGSRRGRSRPRATGSASAKW
jgi:hypothetical protein